MPYNNNYHIGIRNNPLVKSVYVQNYNFGMIPTPPPGSEFMISELSANKMITETNDRMIAE